MKAYKYDKNAYYSGVIEVQKDPKGGGYLLPKGSTLIAPGFEAGKRAKFVNGEWLFEDIDYSELEALAAAAKAARQAAKPDKLKHAENEYLALIAEINSTECLGILYGDNSAQIMEKASALSMTKKSYYGMLLQNAVREVELAGGSWYDLPNQTHNLLN